MHVPGSAASSMLRQSPMWFVQRTHLSMPSFKALYARRATRHNIQYRELRRSAWARWAQRADDATAPGLASSKALGPFLGKSGADGAIVSRPLVARPW